VLIRADAAAALSKIEPSSASILAAHVIHAVGPAVRERMRVPASRGTSVWIQASVIGSIVGALLKCCEFAGDDEAAQTLPNDCYEWVVLNAQSYDGSPEASAQIFAVGAQAFFANDQRDYAGVLFALALLATRTRTPDAVLQLIASGADLLAGIDSGESLQRGVELIETTETFSATRQKHRLSGARLRH
jgi:hypothetical protein